MARTPTPILPPPRPRVAPPVGQLPRPVIPVVSRFPNPVVTTGTRKR